MFKKARWIAEDSKITEITPAPLLRKTFVVQKTVKKATMYACGLGHACYYINGKNITDEVLITPVSKYDTRVYYSTFDVTDFISDGKNAIGCVLGNGWYFVTIPRWDYYKPDWLSHPKLIMKLVLDYADGTTEEMVTDSSWKAAKSAIIYNEDRRGEIYDARLYIDGWNESDFDDSEWKNAFVCRGAGGVMQEIDFPTIRVVKRFQGTKISENVYDIGQNISGWVRIKVKGEAGSKVTIRYAEILNNDGSIAPEQLNTIPGSATHTDKYILRGNEVEEWAPSFAYHGFRYAEITGDAEIIEVTGEVVHTDIDVVGRFECNLDMLNKIHNATVWSTLTNTQGIITDCTQREQNGWTGDALVSAEQSIMNFDMFPIYKKWLVDICDTQRPNGQICCLAPTSGWGYNWGSGPAWDSALILIPYYVYKLTGDISLIENYWDNMALYMEFMESMSENDEVCFGLGDWCYPTGAEPCPIVITDTAYFYIDNKVMAEFAELLGKDGSSYSVRAEQIKNSFRKKYIEKDFNLGDNAVAIACGIYQDLYTDEEKPLAAKHLSELYERNGFHIDCGILGIKYLYTALSEYGYAETAYKLTVNPEYPSYAYWINSGMTTLCEEWNMSGSCNHHMFSEVDMWFYKYVAGIQIQDNGKTVKICPCKLTDVEWVRASHKGILVYFDKEKMEITSDIPVTAVTENGEIFLGAGTHTIER